MEKLRKRKQLPIAPEMFEKFKAEWTVMDVDEKMVAVAMFLMLHWSKIREFPS